MGNASVRGGKGSQSGYDGEEEGEMDDGKEPNGDDCSSELMSQSPAHSPTEAATLPVMFPPQIPVEPIPDEMYSQTSMWGHGYAENDDIGYYEHGIPTVLTWSYGGREVAVEGSWDNWRTRKLLQRSGKDFTLMKVLPSGVYQYRFFVDGKQRYVPDMPCGLDQMGNVCNVLDLQESVPDQLDGLAGFEPPQSPESSYADLSLSLEDFAKEPPSAPPHLHVTLLNMQSNVDDPLPMSRPQQAVLNHLYVHKGKLGHSVVALGVTQRFLAKFVTVVLYKSLEK